MTHGPPKYHGDAITKDFDSKVIYIGCEEFMKRVDKLKDVKYSVYGHVHQGYGVTEHKGMENGIKFVNASTCNSHYYVANKPIMFYVKGKRDADDDHHEIEKKDAEADEKKKLIRNAFDEVDKDKCGFIKLEDLLKVLVLLNGVKMKDEGLDIAVDDDKMSYDEFERWYMSSGYFD